MDIFTGDVNLRENVFCDILPVAEIAAVHESHNGVGADLCTLRKPRLNFDCLIELVNGRSALNMDGSDYLDNFGPAGGLEDGGKLFIAGKAEGEVGGLAEGSWGDGDLGAVVVQLPSSLGCDIRELLHDILVNCVAFSCGKNKMQKWFKMDHMLLMFCYTATFYGGRDVCLHSKGKCDMY